MALQVKICGITSADAADAALRAGADFAGLVFHRNSPRNLSRERAAELAQRMRGRIRLVALLSEPNDDDIAAAMAAANPDFIQLHGRESPERVAAIKTRTGKEIIKVVAIAEAADFAPVPSYENVADMLLFDARPPQSATREGGHGAPF